MFEGEGVFSGVREIRLGAIDCSARDTKKAPYRLGVLFLIARRSELKLTACCLRLRIQHFRVGCLPSTISANVRRLKGLSISIEV